MKVFEGYTKTNKHIIIELDTDTGRLYVVYDSGRRVKYNDEQYTEDTDFFFLLNNFRKA